MGYHAKSHFFNLFYDQELDVMMNTTGCLSSERRGLFQNCWQQLNRWTIRHLSNPIELMSEILPEWVGTVNQVIGYGHFYPLQSDFSKVCVHYACASSVDELQVAKLRGDLIDLFTRHHLEAVNLHITVLTLEQEMSPYHSKMLQKPLENQYYQLFLMALNDAEWWETYKESCLELEIIHYVRRYLRTNLEEFFSAEVSDSDLAHWVHIFEPLLQVGWDKETLLPLAISLEESWKTPDRYLTIGRLIDESAMQIRR